MARKRSKSSGISKLLKDNAMLIAVFVFGIPLLCLLFIFTGDEEEFKNKLTNHSEKTVSTKESQSFSLQSANLLSVVDGDTLYCKLNEEEVYVRLIGVDTAESVNPDPSKNNEYGEMASSYTKSLLDGHDTIYLEFDEDPSDTYDRLLAYVWLSSEVDGEDERDMASYLLNYILLSEGYAYDLPVAPNLKYAGYFGKACEDAKMTNTGLWSYKNYRNLYLEK